MSIADHEIPTNQLAAAAAAAESGGHELAPDEITEVNRPIYLLVIGGLILALLFGLVAWFVLAIRGEAMPEGMAVLIGSIGGGLIGVITTSKTD